MNLLEARASGKWYRRPGWGDVWHKKEGGVTCFRGDIHGDSGRSMTHVYIVQGEHLDATDYELEPDAPVTKKVTVWRPIIYWPDGSYSMVGLWRTHKIDCGVGNGERHVGWESKEIEVTE